jgi:hypothetical protein
MKAVTHFFPVSQAHVEILTAIFNPVVALISA